ncbi:hypothetical protein BDW22DRAFT_1361615 [Trametopsis cervina]|nr:hypothetical protein BDW22DRAFT_1361615 [Trametopsis cervina]
MSGVCALCVPIDPSLASTSLGYRTIEISLSSLPSPLQTARTSPRAHCVAHYRSPRPEFCPSDGRSEGVLSTPDRTQSHWGDSRADSSLWDGLVPIIGIQSQLRRLNVGDCV